MNRIYAGTSHSKIPMDGWMIKYEREQKELVGEVEVPVKAEGQFTCTAENELGAIVEFIRHLKGLHNSIVSYDMNILAITGIYRIEYEMISFANYDVYYQQVL